MTTRGTSAELPAGGHSSLALFYHVLFATDAAFNQGYHARVKLEHANPSLLSTLLR